MCFWISSIHWKLMLEGLTIKVAPDWILSRVTQQWGQ